MECEYCRSPPATLQQDSGRTLCAGCAFQDILGEAASRDLEDRIQPAVLEWRDEWLGRGLTLNELIGLVARMEALATGEMLLAERGGFRVAPLLPCDLHGTHNEPFLRGYFAVGPFGPLTRTLAGALPPGVIFCVAGQPGAPAWAQAAVQGIVQLFSQDPSVVANLVCFSPAGGGRVQVMAFAGHAQAADPDHDEPGTLPVLSPSRPHRV